MRLASVRQRSFERGFVRLIWANLKASVHHVDPIAILKSTREGRHYFTKASVSDTGTDDLVVQELGRAFISPQSLPTIINQLNLVQVPPYTLITRPSVLPVAQFAGPGRLLDVGRMSVTGARILFVPDLGIIIVFPRELEQLREDEALDYVGAQCKRAIRDGVGGVFLSASSATSDAPAGILNGVSAAGAGSPSTLTDDIETMWSAVSGGEPERPHYIASARGAAYLCSLHADGVPLFPRAFPTGNGDINGVRLLIDKAAGSRLILVDSSRIGKYEEGITVTPSREASIEMSDTPSNSAATATAANLTSLFQTNCFAVRFTQRITWLPIDVDHASYVELPIGGSPA